MTAGAAAAGEVWEKKPGACVDWAKLGFKPPAAAGCPKKPEVAAGVAAAGWPKKLGVLGVVVVAAAAGWPKKLGVVVVGPAAAVWPKKPAPGLGWPKAGAAVWPKDGAAVWPKDGAAVWPNAGCGVGAVAAAAVVVLVNGEAVGEKNEDCVVGSWPKAGVWPKGEAAGTVPKASPAVVVDGVAAG